ncbi:hypothetical protein BJX64DRAFT_295341 [Aspergillus heterothallicus]
MSLLQVMCESTETETSVAAAAFGYIISHDLSSQEEYPHADPVKDHDFHYACDTFTMNPYCWIYPASTTFHHNDEPDFIAATCTASEHKLTIQPDRVINPANTINLLSATQFSTSDREAIPQVALKPQQKPQQKQKQQSTTTYHGIPRNRRWKSFHDGVRTRTMVFDPSITAPALAPTINRLNWGSDTRFRIDACAHVGDGSSASWFTSRSSRSTYYAVPRGQPGEEEITARILRNSAELIRQYTGLLATIQRTMPTPSRPPPPPPPQPPSVPRRVGGTVDKDSRTISQTLYHQHQHQHHHHPPSPIPLVRPPKRKRRRICHSSNNDDDDDAANAQARKESHIRSEQVRRQLVNSGFHELKMLVPGLRYQAYSKA